MRKSIVRSNIEKLFTEHQLTDYRIAKDTGLSISRVQDIRNGKSNLDNIKLLNAERLSDYYNTKVKKKVKR